jgi:hypothetical protein
VAASGQIALVNGQVDELLGYRREEQTGQPPGPAAGADQPHIRPVV